MIEKRKAIRSNAVRKSAKDEACTICGKNDGTTVFCHLNESWAGKGMGQKADDIAGFFGCSECHRKYDTYELMPISGEKVIREIDVLRAIYRTWRSLIEKGVITIKP